jgi:hypothetical protein
MPYHGFQLIGRRFSGIAEIDLMVQALIRDIQGISLLFHERMHHGHGGGLFIIWPNVHALHAQALVNGQKLRL